MRVSASILILLACCGCSTQTINRGAFDQKTGRHGLGHFFYTGSDTRYHYFASKYFMEPTHRYRMLRSEYVITNTFARTRNRDSWVVWGVDLASGKEGFSGEQVHSLSERSAK